METVLRVVIIYFAVVAGMRVIGKREFSQLAAHEFVILLIIPEMVSTSLNQNDKSLTNALVGLATILALVFLTSLFSHRYKPIERLISDSAAVLVHRGQVFDDTCNKERVTPEEIMSEARRSGVERFEDIKWAVLESDGHIAVIKADSVGNTRGDDSSTKS